MSRERVSDWSLRVGRLRGVDIYVHVSVVAGILFFGRMLGGPWMVVGYVIVVLVHEFGHALMALRFDQDVYGVQLHAFGGLCAYQGAQTPMERALIAWGGVLAQGALALAALPFTFVGGLPGPLLYALLPWNLAIAAFNLIPMRRLDGVEAWRIVPLLRARWRRRKTAERRKTTRDVKSREVAARAERVGLRVVRDPGTGEFHVESDD